jgi:aldose 1-epimerase
VDNPDTVPLPFGLGFHPYFHIPADGSTTLQAIARRRYELVEGLPTGRLLDLDPTHDVRQPQPVTALSLDDVYTDLPPADSLRSVGAVNRPEGTVTVSASPDFRELVLFTPPHRQAVCIEPYTCATDAVNLQTRGIDAGWKELAAGAAWESDVLFTWTPRQPR